MSNGGPLDNGYFTLLFVKMQKIKTVICLKNVPLTSILRVLLRQGRYQSERNWHFYVPGLRNHNTAKNQNAEKREMTHRMRSSRRGKGCWDQLGARGHWGYRNGQLTTGEEKNRNESKKGILGRERESGPSLAPYC